MSRHRLSRLVPGAPAPLLDILDPSRGPVDPPIRAELFGPARFHQHGRSLGEAHDARVRGRRSGTFFPRLRDNARVLRETHAYTGRQATAGQEISPAGEWLLDNFHLIEAQLEEIHDALPRSYFRNLPLLVDAHLAGLPRIYGVAWAFVAHTDSAFSEDLLASFLSGYQETRELTLGELWALPTTLRVVLLENLRRLSERVATSRAAREVANLACDRIEEVTVQELSELHELMRERGVGRPFALQVAQRLQDDRPVVQSRVYEWLSHALPDGAVEQTQQQAERAANNLSVSNAITALRRLGQADWREIFSRCGALLQVMQQSPAFTTERDDTQDQTLHAIERLARLSARSEVEVGRILLDLMRTAPGGDDAHAVPGYWLRGEGRRTLYQALGLQDSPLLWWEQRRRRLVLPAYLLALGLGTAVLSALVLAHAPARALGGGIVALAVLLVLLPASEAVVAVCNRLISEWARPSRLPRLALADGIPQRHRVMVVVPAMLTSEAGALALARQLELHYLANPEPHAQFALLTDWADADSAALARDEVLLDAAVRAVQAMNLRYPAEGGTRFLLLHRRRSWCQTEQRWLGWERKRGKLEQLVEALALQQPGPFLQLGEDGALARMAHPTPYVLTLDADTQLPPGRLRELVGVAAHPHNTPRVDARLRKVVAGYGVLQPRIATPLPHPGEATRYHWLFAGQTGIDPYSAASSEVYQDLFGEGTFTGKGLFHVEAMHAVMAGRLPAERVLSHDLLEGSMARCASVSNVVLLEDAPFHAEVAASRVHRWTRGDWQLLPILLRAGSYGIAAINRWKMVDNLRRSLVAPASLGLLLLSLATQAVPPGVALALVFAAFSAGPLMGAAAGMVASRDRLAWGYFYRRALADFARALAAGVWGLALLLHDAVLLADAVVRTLWRLLVSKRHLLQWVTAAAVQASASARLPAIARKQWRSVAGALLLLAALLAAGTPFPVLAVVLCLAWAASPLWIWWASVPLAARARDPLAPPDRQYLLGVARDTWRLFERWIGPQDNHLPPDNLQVLPHDIVAHRTSPTNIGLYLLASACARRFGWIGTQDLLERLEATFASLGRLERHRGHFLNWYDTQTLAALPPAYVSTVDSGNLCGHLLTLSQALEELAAQPWDSGPAQAAIGFASQRARAGVADLRALLPGTALLSLAELEDPWAVLRGDAPALLRLCERASAELAGLADEKAEAQAQRGEGEGEGTSGAIPLAPLDSVAPAPPEALLDMLADLVATLRSHARDLQQAGEAGAASQAAQRLRALAGTSRTLALEPEFGFLYHRKRRLLHIGLRVAEQQLDASFYDLLASESRLTSLLAIAKGDLPPGHWASLGRPLYAVGTQPALRSWSGSMFEYLMPLLVLDEPRESLLQGADLSAVREQQDFGRHHGVPWGVSECAYAASDHTLAYQYAPQGVPRLALRRTPQDELVIAPYATALAAQVDAPAAVRNFQALERLGARGRLGFIEALDYTAGRQAGNLPYTKVATFMAHHQGMGVVALANVLLDGLPRRWCMSHPRVQAFASLLHERPPREVSSLLAPPPLPAPTDDRAGAFGLRQEVAPAEAALLPTHLLSNGRYTVALRGNGAGYSQFGDAFLTRWRDDALRDAHGSFLYLRREGAQDPVSLSQHPAPDPQARYRSTYHADRVCLDAAWNDLETRVTVWVSPEDDIELRRVELRNTGDQEIVLDLMSCFEASLSPARADESHPAFANLFVRAAWCPQERALYLERKPRLATEQGLHAVHFLADAGKRAGEVRPQASRLEWLGRNGDPGRPLARFGAAHAVQAGGMPQAAADAALQELYTGLDPVAALSVRITLPPHSNARLAFATAAGASHDALRALVDTYRQRHHVDRSSLMSATLAGIRLREMRVSAENFSAIQTLTSLLALLHARRPAAETPANEVCDKRLLWRLSISGDRPIVLVQAGVVQGVGLLRSLVQAMRLWSFAGLPCDVVVVNREPDSYLMLVHSELVALRERYLAETGSLVAPGRACALHLLRARELSAEELSTLRALARLRLNADGRPLNHHVQDIAQWHQEHEADRQSLAGRAVSLAPRAWAAADPAQAQGEFDGRSGEFRFDAQDAARPRRPWVNVLANPVFGAQLSEAGGGYTWGGNSRMNQFTAWSNDPIADPAAEWFLLQDARGGQAWNVAGGAGGVEGGYQVRHGQGYTAIAHRRRDLEVEATWCVDTALALKQVQLRLRQRGSGTLRLRCLGMLEWMMGAQRSDRQSVATFCERLILAPTGGAQGVVGQAPRGIDVLFATQRERSGGFGGGTAFFTLVQSSPAGEAPHLDWTCDRRELFDAGGRLLLPERLGRQAGNGLDPCAALAQAITLPAGGEVELVFLVGYADNPGEARTLASRALAQAVDPGQRLREVRRHWDSLLGAATVRTPDPLFDVLVNRWLLYQTVACRMWARAGFYQAGGAFGFRDQLQDAMALSIAAPAMLRRQILVNAARQFPEGDVQHWWHAPGGAGVRTRFSDDLLWLPFAAAHYLRASGDAALLDEQVPFLDPLPIPEGAEDLYYAPAAADAQASVYEHCARALDRSMTRGAHGLPLMGTGDWNDGMNRVGHEGRGESVWLAWFLCRVVAEFAPIAQGRGDDARAARWLAMAEGWRRALLEQGWDGMWFKRAFFDDGSPLGSKDNAECRIDLIAQAWSVLSGAAPPAERQAAMASVETLLVDHEAGLMRLLDPPLQHAVPSAGYIQAYPPGVRENGGQYSHAGVWALMAWAAMGDGDRAWRSFRQLSPAHRARDPRQSAAYELEPYVMAGDIYTQPPYVGRGGWSWYTGSAAWLYRAALESICGMRLEARQVSFTPCLPGGWTHATLFLRRGAARHEFVLCHAGSGEAQAQALARGAKLLRPGAALPLAELVDGDVHLVVVDEIALPPDAPSVRGLLRDEPAGTPSGGSSDALEGVASLNRSP